MKWRILDSPEAVAAWKAGHRRVPFVLVTCDCGAVGCFRSRRFGQRKAVDVRCGACGATIALPAR